MANKTFCPIMTIGFGPPEEGKRDLRLCMKDCAWYDVAEEKCKINVISEHLEYIISCVDTPANGGYYDPDGYIEEEWDKPSSTCTKT